MGRMLILSLQQGEKFLQLILEFSMKTSLSVITWRSSPIELLALLTLSVQTYHRLAHDPICQFKHYF